MWLHNIRVSATLKIIYGELRHRTEKGFHYMVNLIKQLIPEEESIFDQLGNIFYMITDIIIASVHEFVVFHSQLNGWVTLLSTN